MAVLPNYNMGTGSFSLPQQPEMPRCSVAPYSCGGTRQFECPFLFFLSFFFTNAS